MSAAARLPARAVSVAVHDVAPGTLDACRTLVERLDAVVASPLTLLVVPRYRGRSRDAAFERWIGERLARGDELALHGLTHHDGGPPPAGAADRLVRRWYTAGEGEFAALGRDAAHRRIEAGLRWLAHRGWPARGFVAPAWLLAPGAWAALDGAPFDYTCTLTRVVPLPLRDAGDALHAWSVVFSTRAAWRRALTVPWNAAAARLQRERALLRFELHPADAAHAAVMDAATRLLARALADGRTPTTLGGAVDCFCAGR